ncbi:MAG: hypothetical protein IPM39_15215 [Chloroflexi bacterium]|nr:hypothetical protein [Chloroflexota bacterium]
MTIILRSQQLLTIVATGGVIVPEPSAALVAAWLTCSNCGQPYPLRPGASAFLMNDSCVQVRQGFVEVCPHCRHEHLPGSHLLMT